MSSPHSLVLWDAEGYHVWQCTGVFACLIHIASQRHPPHRMKYIHKMFGPWNCWDMAYESAPKVNQCWFSSMCWSDAMSVELCEAFQKKKYMNTLISSILIHLLLVDYFPIHICLAPGFINHKCTVVPCVIVSMLDASHHWRAWVWLALFLSLFTDRFAY